MLDAIILLLRLAIVLVLRFLFSRSKARKDSYQGWLIRAPLRRFVILLCQTTLVRYQV